MKDQTDFDAMIAQGNAGVVLVKGAIAFSAMAAAGARIVELVQANQDAVRQAAVIAPLAK